jgi:hypothetical protein
VIFIHIEAFAWSFHSERAKLAVGFDVEPDEHDRKKRFKHQTESLGFQAQIKPCLEASSSRINKT